MAYNCKMGMVTLPNIDLNENNLQKSEEDTF